MKDKLRTLSNFGLALTFIFSLLLNPVLAQVSDTPADVPVSEAPYFYLETNFIDLGADRSGSYKIFAHSFVKWQTASLAIDQKILTFSKTSGQGPAEISFSVDKSKLESGWQDLLVNYNWQAAYQGTEITGSDSLTIRIHIQPEAPISKAPVQEEQPVTKPIPETSIQEGQPEAPKVKPQEKKPEIFIVGLIKLIKKLIDFFKKTFTVYSIHEECWIKKKPRLTSFVLEFIPKGTPLIILEARRPWYKVLNENTGTVGWTHESQFRYIEIDLRIEGVPSRGSGYCEPEAYTSIKA